LLDTSGTQLELADTKDGKSRQTGVASKMTSLMRRVSCNTGMLALRDDMLYPHREASTFPALSE